MNESKFTDIDKKVHIDSNILSKRINRFFESWKSEEDIIVIIYGKQDADKEGNTTRTIQLHHWLFGYELPECLLLFIKKPQKLVVICGPKKLKYLSGIECPTLELVEKGNTTELKEKISVYLTSGSSQQDSLVIGLLTSKHEVGLGPFSEEVLKIIDNFPNSSRVSFDLKLAVLLYCHDEIAMEHETKAAIFACRLLRELMINRIKEIIDREIDEKHETICGRAMSSLGDQQRIEKWKTKYNLDISLMEILTVCVQSGNNLSLKVSKQPTSESLHLGSGVVIVTCATKYGELSAHVTRTLLMNPTEHQSTAYNILLNTYEAALKSMKPGVPLKKVYEIAKSFINKKSPELGSKLTRNLGHAVGYEFKETLLSISPTCESVICVGMTFNLSVGLADVKTKDITYSLWIADTVAINRDGGVAVLTNSANKRQDQVSFEFNDEVKPEEARSTGKPQIVKDEKNKQKIRTTAVPHTTEGVVIKDRLRSRAAASAAQTELDTLLSKQKIIRKNKSTEIEERFSKTNLTNLSLGEKQHVQKLSAVIAYNSHSEYPKDLKPNKIFLDTFKESILLPIGGVHVPFHVSTIRNVVNQEDENKRHFSFRINFQVPGSTSLSKEDNPLPDVTSHHGIYVKELVFRSSDDRFASIAKGFRELQKKVKNRETLLLQKREEGTNEVLELNRSPKRVILRNLMLRHSAGSSRKVMGTLEAHVNGLRYAATRMESTDILFSNIRIAVFQPCENDMIVLLHFYLKVPQLITKKRVDNIQFFSEMGNVAEDLDQRRGRRTCDPDELLEEQMELEAKRKLNLTFKRFVEELEEMKVSVDIPIRKLAFFGVPKNSNVLLIPTARALVHLVEWPCFVLMVEDVEVVSFERVVHGIRNFDIAFVFKDYAKPPTMVSNVPISSLDMIRKWLNEMEIPWYENKRNLNWNNVMKSLREDIAAFVEQGSFAALLGDDLSPTGEGAESKVGSDTEDDQDSDDDGVYEDEEAEDEGSEYSDSDDDDESLAEEGEDSEEYRDLSSNEEEGLDWDELEKEAIRDDKRRGLEGREEEIQRKKRKP